MTEWTAGYVADIDYTYGYYPELNPLRARLAFLNAGLRYPEVGTACELGFGQGMSINCHAAASVIQWYGTDFNPAQAAFAQELAAVCGSGARLGDESFAEFCRRSDLPDFDYIGLHGIWSWISDENRKVIVDFIRRKLKLGGVLYISYNTLPGWAAFAPMRHLLTEHAERLGAAGQGTAGCVEAALAFSEGLLKTNPLYARANPAVEKRFEQLKGQDRHYLAHEFFNRDWHPMFFDTLADWLAEAKLSYAGSAHYLDHIDVIHLVPEQQALLQGIPDPVFRQTVRDFMVNQQFRRDYWVKGARRLTGLEQSEALRAQRVVLTTRREDIALKVEGSLGEANLDAAVYVPVLDLLADYRPRTLGQIEQALAAKDINLAKIVQAVMVLAGMGHLAPAQEDAVVGKAKKITDRFNRHLLHKAQSSRDMAYLASPVTGGGVSVDRFQQLFLLALGRGKKQPTEWAQATWQIIDSQGQRLVKEGKTLETPEENLAELTTQATEFAEKRLPILKALQIA